jgi:hypothetical protein
LGRKPTTALDKLLKKDLKLRDARSYELTSEDLKSMIVKGDTPEERMEWRGESASDVLFWEMKTAEDSKVRVMAASNLLRESGLGRSREHVVRHTLTPETAIVLGATIKELRELRETYGDDIIDAEILEGDSGGDGN